MGTENVISLKTDEEKYDDKQVLMSAEQFITVSWSNTSLISKLEQSIIFVHSTFLKQHLHFTNTYRFSGRSKMEMAERSLTASTII